MDDHLSCALLQESGIMELSAGTAIYPLHLCKTIHLVPLNTEIQTCK